MAVGGRGIGGLVTLTLLVLLAGPPAYARFAAVREPAAPTEPDILGCRPWRRGADLPRATEPERPAGVPTQRSVFCAVGVAQGRGQRRPAEGGRSGWRRSVAVGAVVAAIAAGVDGGDAEGAPDQAPARVEPIKGSDVSGVRALHRCCSAASPGIYRRHRSWPAVLSRWEGGTQSSPTTSAPRGQRQHLHVHQPEAARVRSGDPSWSATFGRPASRPRPADGHVGRDRRLPGAGCHRVRGRGGLSPFSRHQRWKSPRAQVCDSSSVAAGADCPSEAARCSGGRVPQFAPP